MEKFFHLKENGTTVSTEIIAGLTTFFAMSYIIFVNPNMLSQTGMPFGAVFLATIFASVVGTLVMGLFANVPYAQAPGMGLNAFFTFTVVFALGFTWQEALAMVFLCGVVNILITVTKIRKSIIKAIPVSLQNAIGGGIGIFVAYIGLKNAGLCLKCVTLTAKDKACPLEERQCTPQHCPRARGYYDRVNDALYRFLNAHSHFTREAIAAFCEAEALCPFEFTLDLSLFCDCIICDYNYLFDPVLVFFAVCAVRKQVVHGEAVVLGSLGVLHVFDAVVVVQLALHHHVVANGKLGMVEAHIVVVIVLLDVDLVAVLILHAHVKAKALQLFHQHAERLRRRIAARAARLRRRRRCFPVHPTNRP